jgi:glycerol kinase
MYPQPGWVEHDPLEIWDSQMAAARQALSASNADPRRVAAIGITNQRETAILWDRASGMPVHNAIVWQCRRTADRCERLKKEGFDAVLRERTGLVTDAYFSGTKVEWMLENVPGCRAKANRGEILFGTVDSWLIYNLTGGRVHATDCSNASRTQLFDIHRLDWDQEILDRFRIPRSVLPRVLGSSTVLGETEPQLFGAAIPIAGVAGDQQAALFGQTMFRPGQAKNTYGTGCFLLMNTGTKAVHSRDLLTTVAWGLDGSVTYALEGSIFIAGAAIQWLRDELKIMETSAESETLAASAGIRRIGSTLLGCVRPGRDIRTDAGFGQGSHRAGYARGHRVSDP